MTNKEAIELLDSFRICVAPTLSKAMSVAINALNASSADGDTISKQTILDALDEIESEVADGEGFLYEKWREYFCDLPPAQPQRAGRWSGLWSEPQDDNSIYGEKLMEGDTIYLLGVEGVVKQEYGAWGWASVEYVPWEKLEENMPHGNRPNFCYCDNFVSFWELKWAFDDGSDWDGVPFIRHGADMRGEQNG